MSDKLICRECGKEYKNWISLSGHIAKKHLIIIKDYYDKYLIKKDINEGICLGLNCRKETTFNGLSYGYCKFCSPKCAQNSLEVRKNYENTCLINSGYKNPSQIPKIKELKKEKSQIKFGTDCPFQAKEVIRKCKQKLSDNYGVENAMQCKEIRERQESSCLINLGYKNASQSPEVNNKKIKTYQKNYGHNNWSSSDKGKEFHRGTSIKYKEDQYNHGEPLCPRIGKKERFSLDILQSYLSIYNIKRNPRIINFFPDGWILELKLVIEYDEYNHKYQLESDKDRDRQFYNAGCYVFRIKESEWLSDQQEVINKFLYIVNYLEYVNKINKEII